jgi:hypothetical protein
MATLIKSGYEITVGDTAVEYQFSDIAVNEEKEILITVNENNSGTIKFTAGDMITGSDTNYRAEVASGKRIMSIKNGVSNLIALGSTSGQKFTVDH